MANSATAMPPDLWRPRYWPLWLAVGLGWLVSQLPYPLQIALGRGLGQIAYWCVPRRRRVADINLALCFPKLNASARKKLLRAHFRSVGMGAVEVGIGWWGSRAKVERLAHVEGLRHLETAATRGRGIILLSAHLTSLELGVRMVNPYLRQLGFMTCAMYKPAYNPVAERVMKARREAHIGGAIIRADDIVGLIAALRRGDAVWYAGDQKAGQRVGVLVDFFGQPARTHVAIAALAKMTRASVVPFFTLRRRDGKGYRLLIYPALSDFPSGDETADARRINALIESVVAENPAQYFWLHRRFTRDGCDPYKPPANRRR